MKTLVPLLFVGLISACAPAPSSSTPIEMASPIGIGSGRYRVRISGGDCHALGYLRADDGTLKSWWRAGSPMRFHAPWGVTCSATLQGLTADERRSTPVIDIAPAAP